MATELESAAQARRWRSPLLAVTTAGLAFALLSGSVLLFAGGYLQRREYWGLVHWAAALATMVPYAVYQARHYLRVRQYVQQTHYRVGLHAFVMMCGAFLTGLPLIVPLERGGSLYVAVDLAHMFFGFVFVVLLSAHLTLVGLLTVARAPAGEMATARASVRYLFAVATVLVCALLLAAAWVSGRP